MRSTHRTAAGFTAAETVVITAIFLIVTAATVVVSNGAAQREEINAETQGLADWLNVVQRAAQRTVAQGTTAGCTVTFKAGSNLANGAELARVSPPICHPQPIYRVEALRPGSRVSLTVTGTSPLAYTPRGTVTVADEVTLSLQLAQSSISRCLRIAGTSGFLATGSNSTGTVCNDASFNQRT